jgi:hypothetical protein
MNLHHVETAMYIKGLAEDINHHATIILPAARPRRQCCTRVTDFYEVKCETWMVGTLGIRDNPVLAFGEDPGWVRI